MRKCEVEWKDKALEDLSKLDEKTQKKIKKRVENHLATHPTQNGYPLKYDWKGFWGYHVDEYRAIYEIVYKIKKKGEGKIVVVVEVGERNARQKESIYNREPPRPTSKNRITERPKARDLKRKVDKN